MGDGNLVLMEELINKTMYLNILKENLIPSAEKLGVRNNFRFYQDNDPKQKPNVIQTWLIWSRPYVMQPPA